MSTPLLYRQLQTQLSQWITPKDKRHLTVFAENIAAILQAQSGCISHWLSYLSHCPCHARSHLERLNYFIHNAKITAQRFYVPLLQQFLKAWEGMPMTLTLDTSLLWDEYCLIEVCLAWGGRSFFCPVWSNDLGALNLISRITSLRPLRFLVLELEMRML